MKELKKIAPISFAKVVGIFGLILGVIADIAIYLGIAITGEVIEGISWTMLVLLPIVYGAIYFIIGLIVSWIYNFLAKNIGGIKLQI